MVLLAMSLLLVAGCENGNNNTQSTSPYVGGSQGLSIGFAEGAPPSDIYDNGGFPFDIGIKLNNKGEYTVSKDDARVSIKGIYYLDYGLNSVNDLIKNPEEDIIAMKKETDGRVVEGIETRVEFNGLNYQNTITGTMTPVNLIAEACYKYETKSNINLCIRDRLTTTKDGVCNVQEKKQVFNSGAPIKIDNFVESAISESS